MNALVPRLKKRREFQRAAKGVRAGRTTLSLQAIPAAGGSPGGDAPAARVGFTTTRKIGNAVVRNRIRRRLRAAAEAERARLRDSVDYVLVARRTAVTAAFADLCADLADGLAQVHAGLDRSRGDGGRGRGNADSRADAGAKPADGRMPGEGNG